MCTHTYTYIHEASHMVVESMLCLSVHFKSQCSPSVIYMYHERVFFKISLSVLTPFFCHRQFTVTNCVCVHTQLHVRVSQ